MQENARSRENGGGECACRRLGLMRFWTIASSLRLLATTKTFCFHFGRADFAALGRNPSWSELAFLTTSYGDRNLPQLRAVMEECPKSAHTVNTKCYLVLLDFCRTIASMHILQRKSEIRHWEELLNVRPSPGQYYLMLPFLHTYSRPAWRPFSA
jgi:hypothetical protein